MVQIIGAHENTLVQADGLDFFFGEQSQLDVEAPDIGSNQKITADGIAGVVGLEAPVGQGPEKQDGTDQVEGPGQFKIKNHPAAAGSQRQADNQPAPKSNVDQAEPSPGRESIQLGSLVRVFCRNS